MQPDSSAFFLLMEDKASEKILNQMDDFNANVITLTVGNDDDGP